MAPAKKSQSKKTTASGKASAEKPAKKATAKKKKAPAKRKAPAKKKVVAKDVEREEASVVESGPPKAGDEAPMEPTVPKAAPAAPDAPAAEPSEGTVPAAPESAVPEPAPEDGDAPAEAPPEAPVRMPSVPHVFGEGGEHAFGRGVGDLLGSVTTGDSAVHEEDEEDEERETALPSEATGTISISSILNKTADLDDEEDDGDVTDDAMEDELMEDAPEGAEEGLLEDEGVDAEPVKRRRGPVPVLVAALLVIVILAVAGVMMFLKKNGPDDAGFLSGMFGGEQPIEEQPIETVPDAATSVSANFIVATDDIEDVDRPVLVTRAVETDVTISDAFEATGEIQKDDAVATGVITVINESAKPYTFIATTRFLNPDGVLFRMAETTSIPANGSVDVEVYADVAGAAGDIGPSTFVIPGLGEALYETVYGRSDASMTGGSGTAIAVSEEDLEAAKSALTERLQAEAGENFKVMVQDDERILPDLITSSELTFDAPEVGTEGAVFNAELTLRFRVLMVPESEVLPMLEDELSSLGQSGAELGTVLYTVEAYDTVTESAEVRAEAPIL